MYTSFFHFIMLVPRRPDNSKNQFLLHTKKAGIQNQITFKDFHSFDLSIMDDHPDIWYRIKIKCHSISRMLRNTWSDKEHERHTLEIFSLPQQAWDLGFVLEHIPVCLFVASCHLLNNTDRVDVKSLGG